MDQVWRAHHEPDLVLRWNEMTFTPVDGGTLLVVLITYPTVELRDQILATGTVDGMEASSARMESVLDTELATLRT